MLFSNKMDIMHIAVEKLDNFWSTNFNEDGYKMRASNMGSKVSRPDTDGFPCLVILENTGKQLKDLLVKEANSISQEFREKSIIYFRTRLQMCYDANGNYME